MVASLWWRWAVRVEDLDHKELLELQRALLLDAVASSQLP
jgi:hypothetical protein